MDGTACVGGPGIETPLAGRVSWNMCSLIVLLATKSQGTQACHARASYLLKATKCGFNLKPPFKSSFYHDFFLIIFYR
jgi:hypothetical protein